MSPPLSIEALPRSYQTFTTIRSVELRTKLTERTGLILGLLSFFDTVDPDDRIKHLLNRFFKYLHQSCTTTEILNLRAKWLVSFADCVYDQLLLVKGGSANTNTNNHLPNNDEFATLVSDLINAIGLYRSVVQFDDQQAEFSLLIDLLTMVPSVVPDHQTTYLIIKQELTELTNDLYAVSSLGIIPCYPSWLLARLRHTHYLVNRLVLHKQFS